MRKVIIVQARMGSTRLPGKVLADLVGRPMLAWQLSRLKSCTAADDIVVATTTLGRDDPVVDLARRLEVRWFRGSEEDVLSRFVGAAREAHADVVVRITADCPLIDPEVTDRVVSVLTANQSTCDYASNSLRRTYARGLDVEAMFRDTLERAHRLGRSQTSREHVTPFIYAERPDLFLCRSVEDDVDNSDLRWTVDAAQDLELVRRLYTGLDLGARILPYREVVAYVRKHPEICLINAGVETWEPQRRGLSDTTGHAGRESFGNREVKGRR